MIWHSVTEKRIFNVLLVITLGFMALTMYYADLTVTSQFSMTLLDSLLDGKYASFYNNCMSAGIAPEGAVYDVGIYIVFAILSLPIWLITKFTSISILSIGCQLWFKLIVVGFSLVEVYCVRGIGRKIGMSNDEQMELTYFALLSQLLIFPTFVAAQYDIIPLSIFLYGILMLFSNKKKTAYILMALSITMKPIAIIGVFGIILIEEKRLIRIIFISSLACIPVVICKLIYLLNPENLASNNNFFNMLLPGLFQSGVDISFGKVSFFVLLLLIVYVFVYLKANVDSDSVMEMMIFSQFLIWSIFVAFACIMPYWSVYLSPFLNLAIFLTAKERRSFTTFVVFITECAITLSMIMKFTWVYGGARTFSYLLLKPLYLAAETSEIATVAGVLRKCGIEIFQPMIISLFIAGIIVLIAMLYLYPKTNSAIDETDESSQVCKKNSILCWGNLLVHVMFCTLCVLCLGIAI